MKRTRNKIKSLIVSRYERIKKLRSEILELEKESLLLSDKKQWFKEVNEVVTYRKDGKKVQEEKTFGRIFWNEDFIDECTGDVLTIERSRNVMVDGEWIV